MFDNIYSKLENNLLFFFDIDYFIKKILRNKYDDYQLFLNKKIEIGYSINNSCLNNFKYSDDNLLNLIIFNNKRKCNFRFSDLNLSNIYTYVNCNIFNVLNNSNCDKFNRLPEIELLSCNFVDLKLLNIDNNLNREFILNKLNYIKDLFLEIVNNNVYLVFIEDISFICLFEVVFFSNSLNIFNYYFCSTYSIIFNSISKNNKSMESYCYITIDRYFNKLEKPEVISNNCYINVVSKLNSYKLSSRKCCVLFSSNISCDIFDTFFYFINGYNIYNRLSIFCNSLNKLVFPKWLNIIEYPNLLKGLYSTPFDNNGIITKKNFIIKNGILISFFLNYYYSMKLGYSIESGHDDEMHNCFVEYSDINNKIIDDNYLIKIMNKGLIVNEFIGSCINVNNGYYSKGIFGYWVENGEIKFPVSEMVIYGNLKNICLNIIKIGNNYNFKNNTKCGSVLISDIMLTGK